MTTLEFRNKIKNKPNFNSYANYVICLVPIILGIYFFGKTYNTANNINDWTHKLIYLIPFSLIVVGLLLFYLISIKDNVHTFKSNLPIDDKMSLINDYFTKIKATNISINQGEISCLYDTFLNMHLILNAYLDSEKIVFKIRIFDFGITELGVTDFGLSYRHSKRFMKYLSQTI